MEREDIEKLLNTQARLTEITHKVDMLRAWVKSIKDRPEISFTGPEIHKILGGFFGEEDSNTLEGLFEKAIADCKKAEAEGNKEDLRSAIAYLRGVARSLEIAKGMEIHSESFKHFLGVAFELDAEYKSRNINELLGEGAGNE